MILHGKQAVEGLTSDGDDGRESGPFGSMNLILVGDPMQLPPMGASPGWAASPRSAGLTIAGRSVWLGLTAAVELTEVMHQLGPDQVRFRETLLRVAEGAATIGDLALLRTKMRDDGVVDTEADSSNDAIRIFLTNEAADNWNWERLQRLGTRTAPINHPGLLRRPRRSLQRSARPCVPAGGGARLHPLQHLDRSRSG